MDEKLLPTVLLVVARDIHIGASILIGGIVTFQFLALGSASSSFTGGFHAVSRQLQRLTFVALVAAFVSALIWLWLEVVTMGGASLMGSFSIVAWQTVLLQTEFGRVWQFRLGLIVLLFALTALRFGENNRQRARVFVVWLLSVVLVASLAWISHAAAVSMQSLGTLGDAVHLFAAAAWIGGLLPLAMFLRRAEASVSLKESAPLVLERFSNLSLCCVAVLIISGSSNSWLLVGSLHSLFTTAYGWLLIAKLALFGVLLFLGAQNRFVVKAKLRTAPPDSHLLTQLRRNVIFETCLGAAVIAIVACLGVTPPARHP